VLDVQPKLGARVRLLATGASNKNDPNGACSVAIAALRSTAPRPVAAENHAAVLKLWSKHHRDLGRSRIQVACRLHAVACELVPGGIAKEITATHATNVLEEIEPSGAVQTARCELAAEFLQDLRRIDAQMRDTKKRLAAAVPGWAWPATASVVACAAARPSLPPLPIRCCSSPGPARRRAGRRR
jgi:transposase